MAEPLDQFSINCWSGPRCCSTSLMVAFAQRDDTQVLDEPLYASYLKLTGLERPYLDQVTQGPAWLPGQSARCSGWAQRCSWEGSSSRRLLPDGG